MTLNDAKRCEFSKISSNHFLTSQKKNKKTHIILIKIHNQQLTPPQDEKNYLLHSVLHCFSSLPQSYGSMKNIHSFQPLLNPTAPDSIVGVPVPSEIENPECIGINKEPAHSTLMAYGSLTEALKANRHASTFCRSLNGLWKFNWVSRPEQRPVDFYKPSFDVSKWKEIPVPSNWQVLGYGTPYYKNAGYTFQKDFPRVMTTPTNKDYTSNEERNPVGSYRREFEVPQAWNGRQLFLTFDGVDAGFFVWINGVKVGYSVNSRNAADFDITKYVKPGKNTLAVEV